MGLINDYKSSSKREIWIEGVLSNFIYGMLGAIVVVAVTLRLDVGVLIAYMAYYFYLGRVVNRPRYVTSLGKFVVFPIPTAIGAFVGYKLSPILITLIIL